MTKIKDRVENNIVVFFLGTLVAGFLAGIGAYQGILKISDRTTIGIESKAELERKANADLPRQHWIKIHGIETENYSLIRLVVSVNGANFSYPSKAVWAEVGNNSERFPLPIATDHYRISFRAFLSDPGDVPTFEAGTQVVDEFSVRQLPVTDRTRDLYLVRGLSNVYGTGQKEVGVQYSVE